MNRVRHRTGLTLLEVVLATALLSILATGLFGMLSSITRAGVRERQRLASAEIANRLILMHLDDKTSLDPLKGKTIPYGIHEYRWRLSEDKIRLREIARRERAGSLGMADPDRFKQITVRVWLAETTGGAFDPDQRPPQATLTRLYDPIHLGRNPDSLRKIMRNPTLMEAWLRDMMGGAAPAPTPPGRGGAR